MPVCDRCGKGYEASSSAVSVVRNATGLHCARVARVAMLAMRIAWVAAFIAVIVCVLGGVIAVLRGAWFRDTAHLYFGASGLRPTREPLAWRFVTQRARTK